MIDQGLVEVVAELGHGLNGRQWPHAPTQRLRVAGQLGQLRQAVSQGGQVPGLGGSQGDAGQNPLQVAQSFEGQANRVQADVVLQPLNHIVAFGELCVVGDRLGQPASQQTRAHRRLGGVHQPEQGVFAAPVGVLVDLKMTPGGRIED